MSDSTDRFSDLISRRHFVELTGATGIAALAGCSGSNEDTGGETSGDDSGDTTESGGGGSGGEDSESGGTTVLDKKLIGATNNGVPTNLHLNPEATQNYDPRAGNFVFERFAAYNFNTKEFEMGALEGWAIDGETVTLTLRDDLKWDTGEDVTARDVLTQFRLMKKMGASLWDFTESVEEGDDDKTVVLNLKRPSNPEVIKHTLANGSLRLYAYHPTFEQFLDKDAEELQQFKWEGDVVASGPFSVESKSKQSWELTRNPEYYGADNINFAGISLLSRGDNTALQQGLMGRELDFVTSLFAPPKIVANFPDSVEEIAISAKWGYGVLFNHDDPDFGKRKVRQAVAHVINRQQVAENAGPRTKAPAPKVTGVAPNDQETWLGDAYDSFESYGMAESQTDKAAALLREAGYSKEGGTWKHSSGRTLGGTYYTPAGWTDWTTATNTVVDQLNAFGFDFEISQKPTGDYFGGYIEGNFKMGAFYWMPGGARSAFPYFPLRWQLNIPDIDGGHNFPEGEQTVPGMDGGEMTIDPLSEIQEVSTTQDRAKTEDLIQRVAWHHNQNLPILGLVSKLDQSWLTDDDWAIPEEGSDARAVKWPSEWLPRQGKLQAKK
ncbi:ABC transporter substrate-binding protein [Haloferax sp. DFSO52]|uniref:ABC transporter substrate-binding protein n=1 Tax=Haloferax sp. DFSO52 TaxID=3388505 RepID=UPI003A8B5FFC